MKKAKLWAHANYEMVEHDDFSRRLNLPAYVKAENYDFLVRRCENLEAENAHLKDKIDHLTPPIWLKVVAWIVSFVGAFFLAELVLKWMRV